MPTFKKIGERPVIGKPQLADSEEEQSEDGEEDEDLASARPLNRDQSDVRVFRAQVGVVNYHGGGGFGGAADAGGLRSPAPLHKNQKAVLAGFRFED